MSTELQPIHVNGERSSALKGGVIDVIDPASQRSVGAVPSCDAQDADEIVASAFRAFRTWSTISIGERGSILHRAADLVRSRSEELATDLTREMGKPISDARKEIAGSADPLDFFAEEMLRRSGEIAPLDAPGSMSLVVEEPVGVCAAIAPWNYPVSLLAWKIAPALAAGCTVVAKPASATPLAALRYIETLNDAGLPPGVLNSITGPGAEIGEALARDDRVSKIAFTGTDAVGRLLMAQGASTLKQLTLELGGHSALVVCADADLERAVKDGAKRSFRNMGQICNAVNRIYVASEIYDRFLDAFVVETEKMTIGHGMDDPDLGPMLSATGLQKARDHTEDAVSKGARLMTGGKPPEGGQYAMGNFYLPTVLADCTQDMHVMQDETFGPVVGIAEFKTIENAIALANDNRFGLVSYAYTSSLANADDLASGIESGTVCINNVDAASLSAPYGGWKDSGLGVELSHFGLDAYLRRKHIRVAT